MYCVQAGKDEKNRRKTRQTFITLAMQLSIVYIYCVPQGQKN